MYYLEPLTLSTKHTTHKIRGIQRLLKLQIPTIKLPFITSSEFFLDYCHSRQINGKAWKELNSVFTTISLRGTVTLRHNAVEANNLELTFVAQNTLNIGSFDSFRRILESNCKLLASKVINPGQADVRFILQSYYKSIKCGSLIHDGNTIDLKAILGEHTRALQVEGINPDIYSAPAKLSSFQLIHLGQHKRISKVTRHGLKTIENRAFPPKEPILHREQLKMLASWSRLIFKHHGPHSLFFAQLTTGELIVQDLFINKEAV